MRNVFVASSLADASLIRNYLTANGIDSQTVEKLRGNIGTPYTEVWVIDERDAHRALDLIQSLQRESTGSDAWPCSQCGETSPASFDLCWKCGHERNDA